MDIDLTKLQQLTESLTPVSDIAVLMDVPESQLRLEIADPSSDTSRIYHRTKALAALKIRQLNIDLAMNGSPVAAQQVNDYIKTMNQDD